MPEKKVYGTTKSGKPITDELIEEYVAEAEAGYDLNKLRPRGRPRMGSAPARSFPVRLDPALQERLDRAAADSGTTRSEVIRCALRAYLGNG